MRQYAGIIGLTGLIVGLIYAYTRVHGGSSTSGVQQTPDSLTGMNSTAVMSQNSNGIPVTIPQQIARIFGIHFVNDKSQNTTITDQQNTHTESSEIHIGIPGILMFTIKPNQSSSGSISHVVSKDGTNVLTVNIDGTNPSDNFIQDISTAISDAADMKPFSSDYLNTTYIPPSDVPRPVTSKLPNTSLGNEGYYGTIRQ